MPLKALVTGANGFVGSALCRFLIQKKIHVRALIRRSSNLSLLEGLEYEPVYGAITDAASVGNAVAGCDWVFHTAGALFASNAGDFYSVNAGGAKILAEACRSNKSLKRLLVVSSLAAGGPVQNGEARHEKMPDTPVSDYGRSKREGEHLALSGFPDLPVTAVRPPMVFGPGDKATLPLFQWASRGWIFRFTGLPMRLSFVFIDDLVRAIWEAAVSEHSLGQSYYVADPQMFDSAEFMKKMAEAAGRRPRTLAIPHQILEPAAKISEWISAVSGKPPVLNSDKIREMRAGSWTCSGAKIAGHLGFNQYTPLDEAFRRTFQWYREKNWI